MELRLDNYSFNCQETLFSIITLTGGPLVARHWQAADASGSVEWGHRIIAVIEAVPVLGAIVALIELVAMNYFCGELEIPQLELPTKPNGVLEFDKTVSLSFDELCTLKILSATSESVLPEYADSVFEVGQAKEKYFVTRRKKGWMTNGISKILPLQGARGDEGRKVRTFCLELLSNLYEFFPSKEAINEVKCFLFQFAWKKKAGFADFLKLLDHLATTVKSLKNKQAMIAILQRHTALVQLQDKIGNRNDIQQSSKWDKVRTMFRAGLFNPTLPHTASEALKLGLHPMPAVPKQQTIVNLYPTIDAINLLHPNDREAGRWLMHHARVMTFRELCKSIRTSCLQLQDTISKWDDFCLITVRGKSQEWMADIGYRFLPKMPKALIPIEHGTFPWETLTHSNNFVIFDDAVYSGDQLKSYLHSLKTEFSSRNKPSFDKPKHLYFIFGSYPSDKNWEKEFESYHFEQNNVHVHVLTNELSKTCGWMMEKEQLSPLLRKQIDELGGRAEKPLLATEWKMPDFMSTSMFVTEGYTYESRSDLNFGTAKPLEGIGPITDVKPPYKQRFAY